MIATYSELIPWYCTLKGKRGEKTASQSCQRLVQRLVHQEKRAVVKHCWFKKWRGMSDAVARSIEFARKTHRYISRDEHYVRRRRADPPLSLTRKAPNSAMIHYARQSNLIPKSPALTPQTPDQLNCPTWTNDSAIAPTAFPSVASSSNKPRESDVIT